MTNRFDRDPYDSNPERSERSDQHVERQRGQSYRERDWSERQRAEREVYRGIIRERVWTRDPRTGNIFGYEQNRRIGPAQANPARSNPAQFNPPPFNQGDESQDSWRSADPRYREQDTWPSGGSRYVEHDDNWRANEIARRPDNYRNWYPAGLPSHSAPGHAAPNHSAPGHSGKGPKGYVRSDARIREDVCDRLSDDDEVDASDISVSVRDAQVTLEGTVTDRHSKHRAEDVAESVRGVREVDNQLRARKGLIRELGDKLKGNEEAEHQGHRGQGPQQLMANSARR